MVVAQLTPTATAADFVAAMRNESIDVLELRGGTYRPGIVYLSNADRTRPLVVRPAAGETVVFSGPSTRPAFYLGLGGPVGRITMQDLIFDGYTMGSDGILWTGNAHDLTLNRMTVRNSTGTPPYSWGLYVSGDGGVGSSNITANDWVFDGGNRTIGGLGIGNTSVPRVKNILARNWHVSNASYAVYSSAGADGVDIDGWSITSSGLTTYAYLSAVFANTQGVIHNVTAVNSGGLYLEPPMVDGGGNTWQAATWVTSIPALLTALADNSVTDIVVANGTYNVSGASRRLADSLWIDERFAGRTNPVTVRAETTGGVTFDGAGSTGWIGLSFTGGAHDQTWQGFRFANGWPTQTGVIVFGGEYGAGYTTGPGPHHITLRDITIAGSIRSTYAGSGDHSMYFSQSVGGVHDILVDGITVDGSGGVNTAATFYHSAPGEPNAYNVTIRRATVTGTYEAFEIWDETVRNIVIEDSTISGARAYAVRYERGGTLTLRRVNSTGSAYGGFYSSLGSNPPGVTFIDCNLQ